MTDKNQPKKSVSGKIGSILITAGIAAVLAAAALFIWNGVSDKQAAGQAESILKTVIALLPEDSAGNSGADTQPVPEPVPESAEGSVPEPVEGPVDSDAALLKWYDEDRPMTVKDANGSACIGYISIPDIDRKLPVLSDWSYAGLRLSPCRYNGTTYARNLVICAHNYESHFGLIKNLTAGAQVIFTDMNGVNWFYEVVYVGIYQPTDIELMVSGEYDLTLFTCTYGGRSRVTVGCMLKAVSA